MTIYIEKITDTVFFITIKANLLELFIFQTSQQSCHLF